MARPKRLDETPPAQEFAPEALDALIGSTRTPEELEALFRQMKKRIVERMLGAELTHHLGYAPGEEKPAEQANHRNGTTPKTVLTDDGALPLDVPRDRAGTFAPQLVPKGVRRLPGFDRYSRSMRGARPSGRFRVTSKSSIRSPSRPM